MGKDVKKSTDKKKLAARSLNQTLNELARITFTKTIEEMSSAAWRRKALKAICR